MSIRIFAIFTHFLTPCSVLTPPLSWEGYDRYSCYKLQLLSCWKRCSFILYLCISALRNFIIRDEKKDKKTEILYINEGKKIYKMLCCVAVNSSIDQKKVFDYLNFLRIIFVDNLLYCCKINTWLVNKHHYTSSQMRNFLFFKYVYHRRWAEKVISNTLIMQSVRFREYSHNLHSHINIYIKKIIQSHSMCVYIGGIRKWTKVFYFLFFREIKNSDFLMLHVLCVIRKWILRFLPFHEIRDF